MFHGSVDSGEHRTKVKQCGATDFVTDHRKPESISIIENQSQTKIDPSSIKTFSVNSSGKTTSIGGINGVGRNFRPVAGGTDGDESFDGAIAHHRKIIPDGVSSSSTINPSISNQITDEEKSSLWKSIVEEADNMQDLIRKIKSMEWRR